MTFKVGNKYGKGRPTIEESSVTQAMRETFMFLLKDNKDKLQEWLDATAKKDPVLAFKLLVEISKRFIPELSRQELTGKDGKELPQPILVNALSGNNSNKESGEHEGKD